MPHVKLERALAGGLVSELVRGRSVLIGPNSSGSLLGLHTPLHPHHATVSMLEFHGFALETLLSGSTIRQPGTVPTLCVLFVLVGWNIFLYQWINMRLASWLTVGLMALYVLMAWAVFSLTAFWPPIAEALVAQVGVFLLVFREKSIVRELALRRMLLAASAQLQERVAATSFYASQEHWTQVVTMLSQTLDLNRLILLDRVIGDHRVREVIAWQCSLDDIYERRRDYHREPYNTAIRERRLVKTVERRFFHSASATEDQYLKPLIFAGDVFGFWAFAIEPEKAAAIPQFETVIDEFASQITMLLYRRQQWLEQHHAEMRHNVQRYLQLEGGDQTYKSLDTSVTFLTQRLNRLENVFAHLGVATIVYNLFGNVLHANTRMVELMKFSTFMPYHMTALDLIVVLYGVDIGEARGFIRRIIFEKDTITIPAILPKHHENSYILNISPIVHGDSNYINNIDEIHPFHIIGILCELVDVSDIQKIHDIKIKLIKWVYDQTRHDLQSIIQSKPLVEKEYLTEDSQKQNMSTLTSTINNFSSILENINSILNIDSQHRNMNVYPADIKDMIDLSLQQFQRESSFKNIVFFVNGPDHTSLAFTSPTEMKYVVHAILSLLIDDAVDNSNIIIDVHEEMGEILCAFSNTGFGMPNDRLQEYLLGDADVISDKFKKLRQAFHFVSKWDADLQAWSDMGVGMRFHVKLKGFM